MQIKVQAIFISLENAAVGRVDTPEIYSLSRKESTQFCAAGVDVWLDWVGE